jgi:hypothetical protein
MPRNLSPSVLAAIAAPQKSMALFLELIFENETLWLWSGTGLFSSGSTSGGGGGIGAEESELLLNTTIIAQTAHNTSANIAYNEINFAPNFTGQTWINNSGAGMLVNSAVEDDSLNPVTPCHVSPISVKTLIPNYHGKWYAHVVPWFGNNGHANIGVNCDSAAWVNASTADQQARGFDGEIIDWYGEGTYEDTVTLLLAARIATMQNFTYAIMVDTGANAAGGSGGYSTTAELISILEYLQSTYFGRPGYQTINGKMVVYFWGPGVSGVDYATAKAAISTPMYWAFQGPTVLGDAWVDAVYDWAHPYSTGVPSGDPYDKAAAESFLSSVSGSSKGAIPCISPGFNGYLTKSVAWSAGKYMPRDSGKCWVSQAAVVNANLPSNTIGIQVPTWNDWEEGSEIESAIDNGITVNASLAGSILSWRVSGGTGDESTISSYLVLATYDGVSAAMVATQAPGLSKTFDLSTVSGWGTVAYQIFVLAIGIACVRTQVSGARLIYSSTGSGGGGGGGGGGGASSASAWDPAATFPYGQVFTGMGWLGRIESVPQTSELTAENMTLQLSGIPPELLGDVINTVRLSGSAALWLGFFSDGQLLADPLQLWDGELDVPTTSDDASICTVSITVENALLALNLASNRRFTTLDQQLDFPGDTGFDYVTAMQDLYLPYPCGIEAAQNITGGNLNNAPSVADSLTIAPAGAQIMAAGLTLQMQATAYFVSGPFATSNPATSTRQVTSVGLWSSSDTGVATVSNGYGANITNGGNNFGTGGGLITGVGPGNCTITFFFGTVSCSITVTVTPTG